MATRKKKTEGKVYIPGITQTWNNVTESLLGQQRINLRKKELCLCHGGVKAILMVFSWIAHNC